MARASATVVPGTPEYPTESVLALPSLLIVCALYVL
jgi:hypothetical protein